jgi:hypothetical protein
MRFDHFRIVVANGCGTNNNVGLAHIFSGMTFGDLDTHRLKTIGNRRTLDVGTGHAEPKVDEHLSDSGHTDAANADEMDVLDSAKHSFWVFGLWS